MNSLYNNNNTFAQILPGENVVDTTNESEDINVSLSSSSDLLEDSNDDVSANMHSRKEDSNHPNPIMNLNNNDFNIKAKVSLN